MYFMSTISVKTVALKETINEPSAKDERTLSIKMSMKPGSLIM